MHHPGQPEPGVFDRTGRSAVSGSVMSPVITSIRLPGVQLRDSSCHVAGAERPLRLISPPCSASQRATTNRTTHTADEVAAVAADQKWWRGSDHLDAAIAGAIEMTILPVCLPDAISRNASVQAKCGDGKYLGVCHPPRAAGCCRVGGSALAATRFQVRSTTGRTRSWLARLA